MEFKFLNLLNGIIYKQEIYNFFWNKEYETVG